MSERHERYLQYMATDQATRTERLTCATKSEQPRAAEILPDVIWRYCASVDGSLARMVEASPESFALPFGLDAAFEAADRVFIDSWTPDDHVRFEALTNPTHADLLDLAREEMTEDDYWIPFNYGDSLVGLLERGSLCFCDWDSEQMYFVIGERLNGHVVGLGDNGWGSYEPRLSHYGHFIDCAYMAYVHRFEPARWDAARAETPTRLCYDDNPLPVLQIPWKRTSQN